MSKADLLYKELILDINENGVWEDPNNVRPKYADGEPAITKSVINKQMKFDNTEFPILTQKRVGMKDSIKEMFWIWQKMSNKVQDLRDVGCNVWNEWEHADGTIGLAYGWQLGNKYRVVKGDKLFLDMLNNGEFSRNVDFDEEAWKEAYQEVNEGVVEYAELNQVDYLLYQLKKNPYSRRIKTTLYCIEDLDEMALEPCVYETHWQLWDGTLNLTVNIRSNDICLGNPYNVTQYAILHRLIAQVTGHQIGELCFNIDNAHIYSRHMDKVLIQVENEMHEAPTVIINPNVKSFYDFTLDDIEFVDYQHSGSIKYEVAI